MYDLQSAESPWMEILYARTLCTRMSIHAYCHRHERRKLAFVWQASYIIYKILAIKDYAWISILCDLEPRRLVMTLPGVAWRKTYHWQKCFNSWVGCPLIKDFTFINNVISVIRGSGGGRVVKLLACRARGPGFDSPSRHLNFRDWLSPASKSRYGWNTAEAT